MRVVSDLRSWFFDIARTVPVSEIAQVYIVDLLVRPNQIDMSDESIVLAQARARTFTDHQKIGDWAMWLSAVNPAVENIYVVQTMGRMSYRSCHKLLGRRLHVYEELADELPVIAKHLHVGLNESRRAD